MSHVIVNQIAVEFAKETLKTLQSWVENLPGDSVQINTTENLSHRDYHVDFEVVMVCHSPNAMNLSVWISGDANGFFLDEMERVASMINCSVDGEYATRVCAGSEPSRSITQDVLLSICDAVKDGAVELIAWELDGVLKSAQTKIVTTANNDLLFYVGSPKWIMSLLVGLGVVKRHVITVNGWGN